jgi:hypothetical protein
MTTTNRQHDLDKVLKQVDITINATAHAQIALYDDCPDIAQSKLLESNTHAQRAGLLLRELGAKGDGPPATVRDFDLSALDNLDTPDTRKLLDGLENLLATAERVDRARGNWMPEKFFGENAPENDTQGTDLADDLYTLIRRLRRDVHGA